MSRKCPSCGNKEIIIDSHEYAYCTVCEMYASAEDFPEQTVFDQITQSYETLVEKLVYEESMVKPDGTYVCRYFSTIVPGGCWLTEEEALAATLAKLEEVVNDEATD